MEKEAAKHLSAVLSSDFPMLDNTEQELEEQYSDTENARAGVSLRKYRNQMAWCRNKVKELLARGYHQDEIANTLHISQPTISRDIHYIQKEIRKNTENYGDHLFGVYRNNLQGIDSWKRSYGQLWTRQEQIVKRRLRQLR